MLLREMAPGAFQRIYGKKKGYLYTVPEKTFHALKGRRTSKEVVSYEPVQPLKTEIIPDVLKALRAAPGLDLHTYDPKNPATRAAVKRDVRRMREMDDSAAYEKWRLEHAPPEIKEMFFAIWTTGIPNVGAGYATGNAAARPGSAALLARDLSTIAKEHQGRWTKHLAVDTRHFTPTQIKSTPLYDEASLVGRSPYYEKIITPEAYNAAPVLSRYKPLPDGAFTRTQGDILLGKKAV
ncbi:MAG: hypothetical protein CMK74_00645 [Pseudomonadales bacterium]|nr:hypothetical protein [Pseudomonadales bacterium]